ncbi:hypothetical protein [Neomicrococcus lactis]|uniref:Uncharacterized protein n=1 Tax=Neomicrococcus lactis TaxID=732241 RepID=A0A7W8YAQ3_9MICC|nr:hypothetical protein [Neomicrococcus lactis]MBB5597957.1 hypothetical protein [Neomicrococcus lactis]
MDRIEQLMNQADPAQGLPAPGPLNLSSLGADDTHTPTFVPTYEEAADNMPENTKDNVVWFKKPAVWIAGAAAAAVVTGVIITNPFAPQQDQRPPAVSPTQSTQSSSSTLNSSSAGPSSSSSAGTSSGAASSSSSTATSRADQLPNGLVPAHPYVHWGDSAQCRAFDVKTVLAAVLGSSKLEPFSGPTEERPVIGCSGNFASYLNVTNQISYEQPNDSFVGAFVAKWDGERWIQLEESTDSTTEVPLQLLPFPALRISYAMEGQTPEERTLEVLKNYGVQPENLAHLMGPNIPSWVYSSDAAWEGFSSEKAGIAGEKRADWSVLTPAPIADSGRQEIFIFDAHGTKVASFMGPEPDGQDQCFSEDLTFRVVARAPLTEGLAASFDLALVTLKDTYGNERTNLRFVPHDQSVTGSGCELPGLIETSSGSWTADFGRFFGFKSNDEIEQFVDSQEWADLIRLANSLQNTK